MTVDVLDTVVTAETPEGILLELRPAGLSARFYAFAVDWLIRMVALNIVAIAARPIGGVGFAVWLILLFLLEWLYPVAFELWRSGATPGKRMFDLKVVMDDGLPVTPVASLARNLLRAADFLPIMYGAAIVSVLTRADCKRLGDLAAATLVVHQPRTTQKVTRAVVAPLAPVRALEPRDQAAVIALATRAPLLSADRLDELAGLAASVAGSHSPPGSQLTQRVLGVAEWLMGRRA
ncbi:MAG TPA: RDD family protein [Steroidobacteraceae bacterium]|nr:RDD family protein [Steroidobacteraceae bacterium]